MKNKKWPEGRHKSLGEQYLALAQAHGVRGVRARLAKHFDESLGSIDKGLQSLPNWKEIKKQARGEIVVPEDAPPLDPTDPQLRRLEASVTRLSDDNRSLRAKLRNSDRTAGIIDALIPVVQDVVRPVEYVKIATPKPRKSQEEVDFVAPLSDQHSDREIRSAATWGLEEYGFDVYRARIWRWARVLKAYLTEHLPNYTCNTLWVPLLGDQVNGDIHDMKHRNSWGNSIKAALAMAEVQAQALLYLADACQRIVVVGISGNHGRTTTKLEYEDPHDNFDYLVTKTMEMLLTEHERIEIFTPHAWSAHLLVRGRLCHINHGHGVQGTWGIPWYGFEKREGRVQRLVNFVGNQPVDYFFYGHFHQTVERPAGQGKAFHSGPFYFTDGFSLNKLSAGHEPEHSVFMFSDKWGKQLAFDIKLRDAEEEAELHAGTWEPPFGQRLLVDEPDTYGVGSLPIIE